MLSRLCEGSDRAVSVALILVSRQRESSQRRPPLESLLGGVERDRDVGYAARDGTERLSNRREPWGSVPAIRLDNLTSLCH